MASSAGVNGQPFSAAMLMDPKSMKKHLANGTSSSSHLLSTPAKPRQSSEPLPLTTSAGIVSTSNPPVRVSKDDAYEIENKGKKAVSQQQNGHNSSSYIDARRLLDPASFNQTRVPNMQTSSVPAADKGGSETNNNNNSSAKRDLDAYEGQGMGSLIERVHNVSQREERPQKKQKSADFADDPDKEAFHGGGGKGGEIGEYMKQKKKEGIAEAGSCSSVVDLTGGMYNLVFLNFGRQ